MKTLLAASVVVALAGAALAAPDAPGLRPTAPEPRTKFVAPKINDRFEVLVYAAQRPVRVRVTTLLEGKSVDEMWRERLQKLFDFCDRDNDGVLSEKEATFAITDASLAQLLVNGYYQPGQANATKFTDLDRNGDGKLSFEEFAASYAKSSALVLRILPPQPDYSGSAGVTEALFKLFDVNGDGKLTRDELKLVEKYLATHDSDEDECLSVQELVPNMFDPRFGIRRVPVVAQPAAGPSPANVSQMVSVFELNKIPGTVTQQLIAKYDKNGDYDLARNEIGFDEAAFNRLDANGNGLLDGEELDAWRTGAPDLELTLSLATKPADCVARFADEKSAEAKGMRVKQYVDGPLVLYVGRQPVDFAAFSSGRQYAQFNLKQQYGYLFTQAAAGKDHVTEKDVNGPNPAQNQVIRVIFESADRDGDGKLTKAEFDAYFDLPTSFRNLSLGLTPTVQVPSLFQLLDENRDGRLGVRELRTAWNRLIVLEVPGADVITKNVIQPAATLRLTNANDRYYINQAAVFQPVNNPSGQVLVLTKGPLWFRKMDRNADGDVSRGEYIGTRAEFDAIDADHDNLISLEEAEAWDKKMRGNDEAKPERK